MKLWLLQPHTEFLKDSPLVPFYDKCFGMVIVAETEDRARLLAQKNAGVERKKVMFGPTEVWLDSKYTMCIDLSGLTQEQLILRDIHSS